MRRHGNRQKVAESDLLKELKSSGVKSVGNYIIGATIGEGSFGKVKLAVHKLTGQEVAVKIIDKIHAPAVIREIETLRKLRHPNIAQLYEVLTTETKIYIVTEYVSGGEIFQHIEENGPMTENRAKIIFRQIAQAMKYCHDRKCVHRDLKLENIMLDKTMSPKIIDFGFTREFEGKDKLLETYCGSTAYAAPEMIAGRKYSGPEADIWSLGVILYTLLCGFLPFDDEVEARLHAKIMALEYELPGHLSPECVDLITRILQLDPKQRLPIEKMLEHQWLSDIQEEALYEKPNSAAGTPFRVPSPLGRLNVDSPSTPKIGSGSRGSPTLPFRPQSQQARQRVSDLQEFLANNSSDAKLLLYFMTLIGFDTYAVIRSLKEEVCDQASGLFYLLLTKMRRNPLLTSSAVLSALSSPALSAEEQLSVFQQLYQSMPPSESPKSPTSDISSVLSPAHEQGISIPNSWDSAITDRTYAMIQLASSSLDINKSFGNTFASIDDQSTKSGMGSRSSSQTMEPEVMAQYYGYLSRMASSNSEVFPASPPEITLDQQSNILQKEILLFGGVSSPVVFKTSFESPEAVGEDESPLEKSKSQDIEVESSTIVTSTPRRASASDAESSITESYTARRKSAHVTKAQPDHDVSDMRDFRERHGSRKQATISEEEEEQSQSSYGSSSFRSDEIHSEGDISRKEPKSPFSRFGGMLKGRTIGIAARFKNLQSPSTPINVEKLNSLIKSSDFSDWEDSKNWDTDEKSELSPTVSRKTKTVVIDQAASIPRISNIQEEHTDVAGSRIITRQSSTSSITEKADGTRVKITTNEERVTYEENGKRIRTVVKEQLTTEEIDESSI